MKWNYESVFVRLANMQAEAFSRYQALPLTSGAAVAALAVYGQLVTRQLRVYARYYREASRG